MYSLPLVAKDPEVSSSLIFFAFFPLRVFPVLLPLLRILPIPGIPTGVPSTSALLTIPAGTPTAVDQYPYVFCKDEICVS